MATAKWKVKTGMQEHAGGKGGEHWRLHPPTDHAGDSQDRQGVKGVDERPPATVVVGGCPDRFLGRP